MANDEGPAKKATKGSNIDHTTISRIAYIRHLYTVGAQQSRQPEPLSSASILTFHDSVELFLHLASEVWDAKPKSDQDFMGYWDVIEPRLPGHHLAHKESMRRLNKARVGLKHSGILPNKGVIDELRTSVTAFFDENTPVVFWEKKFDEISMVDLVRYPKTRSLLKEAESLYAKDDLHKSIEKIGIAFVVLIDEYEETKKGGHGRSPFFFGESVHFADGLAADRSFENIRRSIEALQDAMKILSLGIDYPRYAMFRMHTPAVLPVIGNPTVQWINTPDPTKKTSQACLDFVIETAIQLQAAEYDVQQGEGE